MLSCPRSVFLIVLFPMQTRMERRSLWEIPALPSLYLSDFFFFVVAWNLEEENQEDIRLLEWQPKNQWLTMNMQRRNYALQTSSPWNIKVEIGTRKRVSNQNSFYIPAHHHLRIKNVVQWRISLVHYSAVTYVFLSWPLLSVTPPPIPSHISVNVSIFCNQSFGLYCACSHISVVTCWRINW